MQARCLPILELSSIHNLQWVDTSRRPYVKGNIAFIPVRKGYDYEVEIDERKLYRGRGFQRLGDIVVFHGPEPNDDEVSALVSFVHPRGVVWVRSIDGITRTPKATVIYGSCSDICHHENGFQYWLDPSRIMFAQGNRSERQRMGDLISICKKNERVADMCAGIGYFTVPMARAGATVHAIELSPIAFTYLIRNIMENCIEDKVIPECGDSRNLLKGTYDRFVIGHFDSPSFLPYALRHADHGSTLHVHCTTNCQKQLEHDVEAAGFSAAFKMHKVKKFGPHQWHTVWDITLT